MKKKTIPPLLCENNLCVYYKVEKFLIRKILYQISSLKFVTQNEIFNIIFFSKKTSHLYSFHHKLPVVQMEEKEMQM